MCSSCMSSDGSLSPLAGENETENEQHSQISCQTCQVSTFYYKGDDAHVPKLCALFMKYNAVVSCSRISTLGDHRFKSQPGDK
jgi:hypothetical protein